MFREIGEEYQLKSFGYNARSISRARPALGVESVLVAKEGPDVTHPFLRHSFITYTSAAESDPSMQNRRRRPVSAEARGGARKRLPGVRTQQSPPQPPR